LEFLRWIFFIPSAAAGGFLGFAAGILFAMISKIFNRDLRADNPLTLVVIGCAVAYCWFMAGMLTSPKSQDPKKILFALTVIIIIAVGVGWAPLIYQFNFNDLLAGRYFSFIWGPIGVIGTTAWIWFSKSAKKSMLEISGRVNTSNKNLNGM